MGTLNEEMRAWWKSSASATPRPPSPRRYAQPLAQGHHSCLGRRSAHLCRHSLAGHGREPAPQPDDRGQRRRPHLAQGTASRAPVWCSRRDTFDEALEFYRERGVVNEIRAVVLVEVERVLSLTSPAYDLGATEEEVRERWERHHEALRKGEQGAPTGE